MPTFRATGLLWDSYGDDYENDLEKECSSRDEFISYLREEHSIRNAPPGNYFRYKEDIAIEEIDKDKRIYSTFDIPDFSTESDYEDRVVYALVELEEKEKQEKEEKERLEKEAQAFEKKIKAKESKADELYEYFCLRLKFENVLIPFDDPRLEWMSFAYRFKRLCIQAQESGQKLTSLTVSKKEAFRLGKTGIRLDQRYSNYLPSSGEVYGRFSPDGEDISEKYFGIPIYLSNHLKDNEILVGYSGSIPPVSKDQRHSFSYTMRF